MLFAFHIRQPYDKQLRFAKAVARGAAMISDRVDIINGFRDVLDVDGLIMLGIGGLHDEHARIPYDAYRAAGKHVVFIDKGYTRDDTYRVAVNNFQPLSYLMESDCKSDRFDALKLRMKPYQRTGEFILFDGASEKYCAWKGFGDWVTWGAEQVQRIKEHTNRPIIYRPRPGRNGVPEVPGAITSQIELIKDLQRAHVVVSDGGNIGWDAAVAGIPHFAMGESIARHISETDWNRLDQAFIPTDKQRLQWAHNVAYQQYTAVEFATAKAWNYIRSKMKAVN